MIKVKNGIYKSGGMLLLFSYILLFCGEALLRRDFFGMFTWMVSHPVSFLINWIVLFSLLVFMCTLFNRLGTGVLIVGGIYMTFCIISFYKFVISGEYLTPADLILAGEAASISKEMNIRIERHVVIGVVLSIASILAAYKWDVFHINRKYRMLCGVIFGTLFFTTAAIGAKVCPTGQDLQVDSQSITVNDQYNENGFIVGFTQEIVGLMIERPEGYSEEKVEDLLKPYEVSTPNQDFVKPNIIMIMSESLFDITRLPNVTFSENPLEKFKGYQTNYAGGNIVTSVYGGRTCQTEYEVLTGHSVYFTDPQNIAYMKLVNEDTPSIPKLLKEEGYQTLALHGYEKAFFSRDKAYENLGIDTFIASEDLENPKLAREYISDDALVDEVIKLYETKGDQPLFYHIVTMQNHMPYTEPYTANGITVNSPKLSEEEKSMVETYANGVKDSDIALDKLIQYFSKVDEPTIIVMYGDHLPALGDQHNAYKSLQYIDGDFDEEDCYNLYQTPFVMWNNYGLPSKDFGDIDASYLGSQVLQYIGYNKDPYMNYLTDAERTLKAYGEYFGLDQAGMVKNMNDLSEEEKKALDALWMIQYNRLGFNK